jgi:hypothetical protein
MERNIYKIGKELFITSDEEIKDRDCWVTNGEEVFKPLDDYSLEYANNYWEKIILTTDSTLIADGVQPINNTFLEWFVKNPSCEWVEVGYGWIRLAETDNEGYWVSIPDKQFEMQQEEAKQDTLEEAAHKMLSDYGIKSMGQSIGVLEVKKLMVKMANWQQEQEKNNYSEEEVEMNEELSWDLAKESFKESEGREPDINDTERGELLVVSSLQEGILKGAKWQAERMYSEEDMMFAYEQGTRLALISQSSLALQKGEFPTPKQWFEQFKKK